MIMSPHAPVAAVMADHMEAVMESVEVVFYGHLGKHEDLFVLGPPYKRTNRGPAWILLGPSPLLEPSVFGAFHWVM